MTSETIRKRYQQKTDHGTYFNVPDCHQGDIAEDMESLCEALDKAQTVIKSVLETIQYAPELCMENYNEDEIIALNGGMIEAHNELLNYAEKEMPIKVEGRHE